MRLDFEKTASAALLAAVLAVQPVSAQENSAQAPQKPAGTAQPAAAANPCAGPEMRQFAFWVGEWNLVSRVRTGESSWTEEKGTDSIRPILNGCALLQDWRGTLEGKPFHGMSLTSYVPATGEWQQAWSDDSGPNMHFFTGKMEDGRMVLSREMVVEGKTAYRRQVYFNIKPDSLDWSYDHSTDGKTWTPVWTIHYTRRP